MSDKISYDYLYKDAIKEFSDYVQEADIEALEFLLFGAGVVISPLNLKATSVKSLISHFNEVISNKFNNDKSFSYLNFYCKKFHLQTASRSNRKNIGVSSIGNVVITGQSSLIDNVQLYCQEVGIKFDYVDGRKIIGSWIEVGIEDFLSYLA